jgi:hypothetical protein
MNVNALGRWIARIWGIGVFFLILAFVAGGREGMRPSANEAIALLLFPGGVLIGFAIAWWREGVGGLVSIACLALFYLWMFAYSGRFPTGPYFLVFAAPGFLHAFNALGQRLQKKLTAQPLL